MSLAVENLTVRYDEKIVLDNVTVDFPAAKLSAIVGPNGAGKSTLLKASLDLIPNSGIKKFFGKPLKETKKVAYVPQRSSVDWDFPTYALDVVLMGGYGRLGWFKRPNKIEKDKALQALSKVGMSEFANRQIGQLSGGQQQRVFLARSLMQEANLYLMDEPFAGVDVTTEEIILNLLQELRLQNKTIIMVHHDLETVAKYFDYVVLLNRKIIHEGKTKDTLTPEKIANTYKVLYA